MAFLALKRQFFFSGVILRQLQWRAFRTFFLNSRIRWIKKKKMSVWFLCALHAAPQTFSLCKFQKPMQDVPCLVHVYNFAHFAKWTANSPQLFPGLWDVCFLFQVWHGQWIYWTPVIASIYNLVLMAFERYFCEPSTTFFFFFSLHQATLCSFMTGKSPHTFCHQLMFVNTCKVSKSRQIFEHSIANWERTSAINLAHVEELLVCCKVKFFSGYLQQKQPEGESVRKIVTGTEAAHEFVMRGTLL